MAKQPPYYLFAGLFFLALLALFPGISEITGITGKDEYYLTMRTPMHMIEGQHAWLPWLDGLPRFQKPPLMYWLGKLSFETFGVSLASSRMIGVSFAAILISTTAAISWFLTKNKSTTLLTGLITLGMAGIMIDGRRYLLDIPVAAFSGLSVLCYLLWHQQRLIIYSLLSMLFIGLAFLTKGPVTLIFFLTAIIAWRLSKPVTPERAPRYYSQWILSIPVAVLIVLPWYAYLFELFPEELIATLQQETNDRNIFKFSLSPLLNLIVLALPWSPVLIGLLINHYRHRQDDRAIAKSVIFLSLWLLLSLLPFFFFKTFGRYLYGCLLPLSLLIPVLLSSGINLQQFKIWFRVSSVFTVTIGVILFSLVVWFRGFDMILMLAAASIVIFIVVWWQAKNIFALAITSILYWISVTAIIYPVIGINRLPETAINDISNEYVVLYAGPQPAMLPIVSKRGLRATSRLWTLPADVVGNCTGILLYTTKDMIPMLNTQMTDLKLTSAYISHYSVLSSRGSWVKFTRKGTRAGDWWEAIKNRDLDSLGNDVLLLRVKPNHCS